LRTPEEQLEIEFDGGHHHRETNVEVAEIGMDMVELHVDTHQTIKWRMNATTQFGAT
jgi:hypothetical protein